MKPLNNNVIVSRLEPVLTTLSGILLKSSEEPDRAKVVSVGPEVTEVSVSDVVMIDWNKATHLENDLYAVSVTDIVFVFE